MKGQLKRWNSHYFWGIGWLLHSVATFQFLHKGLVQVQCWVWNTTWQELNSALVASRHMVIFDFWILTLQLLATRADTYQQWKSPTKEWHMPNYNDKKQPKTLRASHSQKQCMFPLLPSNNSNKTALTHHSWWCRSCVFMDSSAIHLTGTGPCNIKDMPYENTSLLFKSHSKQCSSSL